MSVSVVTDKEVKWLQIKLDAFLSALNKSYFSKLWTKFGREWTAGPYNGTVFLLDILQIDEVDGRVTDLFQHIDSTEHSVLFSFSEVCWLLYYAYIYIYIYMYIYMCVCVCMYLNEITVDYTHKWTQD